MPNQITTYANKGKHLTIREREVIKVLYDLKWSNRRIAAELGRAPQTINKEIHAGLVNQVKRVTQDGKTYSYSFNVYSPDLAQSAYDQHRQASRRPLILTDCADFLDWADDMMLHSKWSPDVVVGRAITHKHFKRIPSVSTVYNYIDQGLLKTTNFDLLEKVSRKHKLKHNRHNLRMLGTSIEERPAVVDERSRVGDWEIDTVQGIKGSGEPVLLTLTERKTRFEIIAKLESKSADPVNQVLGTISNLAGSNFGELFKTITADNGTEFTNLAEAVQESTAVYFAHPYSSYERGTNERHNRMIRQFCPKGKSLQEISPKAVERIQHWLNRLPRKQFNYQTPAEMMLQEMQELNLAAA